MLLLYNIPYCVLLTTGYALKRIGAVVINTKVRRDISNCLHLAVDYPSLQKGNIYMHVELFSTQFSVEQADK